jgi:dihydropyrimidine dehydrogenase (NAD+) subunit PreT
LWRLDAESIAHSLISLIPEMDLATAFEEHPEIRERFQELHPALTAQAAVVEANRCLHCFDAPCMGACPTHIDVPGFIKRIASGNVRGSARKILEANVLAGSCSRVCPVEVLCEGACVMHRYDRPAIAIGLLQRHAMDAFHGSGERLIPCPADEIGLRVVCVGAGPASLACAAELRRHGARVTVIDRRALPGGLNTYGVAEYKLSTAASLREIELVREAGVEFRMNLGVGTAAELEALEAEFDFVFLGLGLGAMQGLGIPGESDWRYVDGDLRGVVNALELIAAYKTGHLTRMTGHAVVVGAGNTAIDAAVAARRLGADTVTMLYRRGEADVSAFDFEFAHAKQEGVEFKWKRVPVAIREGENGGLLLDTVAVDDALKPVADSLMTIECETVIPAIGQSPLTELLTELRGVEIDQGRIGIDKATGQTSHARYFAGGDCTNGGREVVDAVADGKRAALGMVAVYMAQQVAEAAHG